MGVCADRVCDLAHELMKMDTNRLDQLGEWVKSGYINEIELHLLLILTNDGNYEEVN